MILALCIYAAVGFIVTLIVIFSDTLNSLGWLAVLIYLFFAVGFGYFLLRERHKPQRQNN